MLALEKWAPAARRRIRNRVRGSKRVTLGYLNLARFLATRGINPPLSGSAEAQERRWREQGAPGASDQPATYVDRSDSMRCHFEEVARSLPQDANILEVGCNAGRNLDFFYREGFRNLWGIEIGPEAVKTFETAYPEAFAKTRVICGNAVDEIRSLPSRFFDLVFTRGVLVNIHPRDASLFGELCRVCGAYLLTSEGEGAWTAWPRNFDQVFEKHGFRMVSYRFLVAGEDGSLGLPRTVNNDNLLANSTVRIFSRQEKTFQAESSEQNTLAECIPHESIGQE